MVSIAIMIMIVMSHLLFFIFQRQNQLLCVWHGQIKVCHKPLLVFRHLLWFYRLLFRRQRVVIVGVVKVRRVLEVHLQYPAFLRIPLHLHNLLFCRHHSFPVEVFLRQMQAHCPSLEVVSIKICDVVRWLCWVVSFDLQVVRFCVPFACH